MKRGYLDFAWHYKMYQAVAFFVTRRVYLCAPIQLDTRVICYQTIALIGLNSKDYIE